MDPSEALGFFVFNSPVKSYASLDDCRYLVPLPSVLGSLWVEVDRYTDAPINHSTYLCLMG